MRAPRAGCSTCVRAPCAGCSACVRLFWLQHVPTPFAGCNACVCPLPAAAVVCACSGCSKLVRPLKVSHARALRAPEISCSGTETQTTSSTALTAAACWTSTASLHPPPPTSTLPLATPSCSRCAPLGPHLGGGGAAPFFFYGLTLRSRSWGLAYTAVTCKHTHALAFGVPRAPHAFFGAPWGVHVGVERRAHWVGRAASCMYTLTTCCRMVSLHAWPPHKGTGERERLDVQVLMHMWILGCV